MSSKNPVNEPVTALTGKHQAVCFNPPFQLFQACSLHLHGIGSYYDDIAPPFYSTPNSLGLIIGVGKSVSLFIHSFVFAASSKCIMAKKKKRKEKKKEFSTNNNIIPNLNNNK